MKHSKWRRGAILLAMVIIAGTMTGIAFAGTESDKDKPDVAAMYQTFIAKFADNLGVTEDEVEQALKDTQLQMIEDAVENGTLTQEQADNMSEKIESGEGCGFRGFGFGHGPGGPGPGPGGEGRGPGPGGNSDNAANE